MDIKFKSQKLTAKISLETYEQMRGSCYSGCERNGLKFCGIDRTFRR